MLATVTSINRGKIVMPSDRGFVNLWRDIDQQPWYKLHKGRYTAVFVHLLLKASHKPTEIEFRGHKLTLMPGQIAKTYEQLARELNQTKSDIQNAIKTFVKHGQITTKTDGKFTIICLNNYLKFNTVSNTVSNTAKPHINQGVEPIVNTVSNTAVNTQNNKPLEEKEKNISVFGETDSRVLKDFSEERQELFQAFWSEWVKCKKLIGVKNTAKKHEAKKKFLNHTLPASKVRRIGLEAAAIEVDKIIDLAWSEHEALKADLDLGIKGFHPIERTHPPRFLDQKGWEDQS